MNRFSLLAIAIAAISFGIAAVASAQEATPTPSPTSTSVAQLCPGPGIRGGETVETINGASVTLPGGGTFVLGITPPGTPDAPFTICYVEGNARVTISATNCDEIRRENPSDSEVSDRLLDVIVDSCERSTPTPTPTPATEDDDATATPTATGGGTIITPPDTGNAGLR